MEPDGRAPAASQEEFVAALGELDATERGFLLGISLVAVPTASLAGAAGRRCARAAAALAALPRAERLRSVSVLAREAMAPVPAGIEDVHGEWLRRLLAAESDDTVRLVAADGPASLAGAAAAVLAERGSAAAVADRAIEAAPAVAAGAAPAEAVAELRRSVLAPIVPVPPLPAGRRPRRRARALAALPVAELTGEVGGAEEARALGAALAADEEDDLARALAQRLPPPLARELLAAAGLEPL